MPRAYCPKCGAEVPVDEQGRCHVGHQVDLAASSGGQDLAEAARGLEAEFEERHPEEPEPWVANVDDDVSGAAPPSVGDEGPGAVTREADDGLEPARRPAASTPGESDGWQPPTTSPVGPGPQPPPEPAAPPEEDLDDDFDLGDLEAAVAELEVEEGRASAEPPQDAVTQSPPPVGAFTADDQDDATPGERDDEDVRDIVMDDAGTEDEPPPPPAGIPTDEMAAAGAQPEPPNQRAYGEPEEPADGTPEEDEPEEEPAWEEERQERDVDLANFTASGDKVGEGGKKRGLFGFGR